MMKRITLLFLLLISQTIFAQFTANDVKFFVGQGTQTAYLVVDFKDGTDDRSYAWGYRFNAGTGETFGKMMAAVATAEPNFIIDPVSGSGFLNEVTFNTHTSVGGGDWWSTWSGTSAQTFAMNVGISESLTDGRWYGASYGFGNPTSQAPVTPIPAYSSQWFKSTDIITWLGTGSNQSLVVVDFGTDTNNVADSYVFGIKYSGSITADDALDLIKTEVTNGFDYVITANELSSITIGSRTETETTSNTWQTYKGTDLSNWIAEDDFSQTTLDDNQWLGLSIGERRPFTPQDITASLSVNDIASVDFSVYPNPANEVLNVQTNETIKQITVYNMQGQKLIQNTSSFLNIASLSSGMYLLELQTTNGISSVKFIKK